MEADELGGVDGLLVESDLAWAGHRPGLARELLLRARQGYLDLRRPADVGRADRFLFDQLAAVHDRQDAWDRLLRDVGWRPAPPEARPESVTVDCLGERHAVSIGGDWTVESEPSQRQRREHVAAALLGVEPDCQRTVRGLLAVRRWAACRQRLAPAPGTWLEPDPLGWEPPRPGEDGWPAGGFRAGRGALRVDAPALWAIEDGPPRSVFDRALREHPAPLPPEGAAEQAADRVGSRSAVEELWRAGVHPGLVVAVHGALALDGPVSPSTIARLVLRRGRLGLYGHEEWVDDPLPVGVVGELLGAASGRQRARMCGFLAAAGGSRDGDDPSRLLRWWQEPDLPAAVRVGLHRWGFDPSDLRRWAGGWGGAGPQELARALRDVVPRRSALPGRLDLVGRVVRGCLPPLGDPYGSAARRVPAHSCDRRLAELHRAVESGDAGRILRAAEAMDRDHPRHNPSREECPVWVAARVQAMAALHADHPAAAAALRDAVREAEHAGGCRAQWVWAVLERGQHRLPSPLPADLDEDQRELVYEMLERPPAAGDPKHAWVARYGPAVGLVWSRLRRSGVTLDQAIRWEPPGCPSAEYVLWLADFIPYPGAVGAPGPDPFAWLVGEARREARLWAAQDHSRLYGPDTYNEERMTRDCLERSHPALEAALAAGDPSRIAAAARGALAEHTYYRDPKSYRYHLDTCPVDELARLVLGVAAFPDDPPRAAELLIGDRDAGGGADGGWGDEEHRYPSPVCMAAWLALTHKSGRLVDDPPLRAKWEQASWAGAEGPWMLRMMLEGFRR